MSFMNPLIGFGLRQVFGVGLDKLADTIGERFRDPTQRLPLALGRANDQAWHAVAIALAGDSFVDQVSRLFTTSDARAMRDAIHRFLIQHAEDFGPADREFRRECLAELKRARKAGKLSLAGLNDDAITPIAAGYAVLSEPDALIEASHQATGRVAEQLASEYPNLARLVGRIVPGQAPLLAAAFAWFFRRELERDEELARGLMLDRLQTLTADQAEGLAGVASSLDRLGSQLNEVLEQLDLIESLVIQTRDVAAETRGAVLDLQHEFQQLGRMQLLDIDEVRGLVRDVIGKLDRVGMEKGEVRPQHSFSIHSEEERRAVRQLLERYRGLSEDQRHQIPALLNGLGKLQIASGDFDGARQTFAEVVREIDDPTGRAEAHFNAYRAALEQRKWEEALSAMRESVACDARRFEPFPLTRYRPIRILGAGGFGTAYLCHDANFGEEVVIKTLHADLDRPMKELFREAIVLRKLAHPSIIGVRDCEFADRERQDRPYIVMDYFPGLSLDIWLREHGNFSADDVLAIARQVGDAMRVAHQQGVLHRDLKPENVLVRKVGNEWEVKVIDFGLAMRRSTIETSIVAASIGETIIGESVAGTILYAPPEQMGRLPGVKVGTYSDVYAFGKMCCFALFQTTEPKSRQLSTIPSTLADVLERCTEHDIEHRLKNFNIVLELLGMSPPQVKQPKPVSKPVVREGSEERRNPSQLRSGLRIDNNNIEMRKQYLEVRTRQLEELDAAMGRVGDSKTAARGGAIIGFMGGVLLGGMVTLGGLGSGVSYSWLVVILFTLAAGLVCGAIGAVITGIGAWNSGAGREKGRVIGPLPYREYGNSLEELKRAYEIE